MKELVFWGKPDERKVYLTDKEYNSALKAWEEGAFYNCKRIDKLLPPKFLVMVSNAPYHDKYDVFYTRDKKLLKYISDIEDILIKCNTDVMILKRFNKYYYKLVNGEIKELEKKIKDSVLISMDDFHNEFYEKKINS